MPGPVHRFFFRLLDLVSYARYRFLPSGPFRRKGLPSLPSRPDLLLVTVAFNRADMIDRQLEMVRQQVKEENCCHLVVDNSTDPRKRKAVREVCRAHGAAYAAVPPGVFPFLARRFTLCSMSHAFALNWAYYRIVRRVRPKFFDFGGHVRAGGQVEAGVVEVMLGHVVDVHMGEADDDGLVLILFHA